MSIIHQLVAEQMPKMLRNLERWLDAAGDEAEALLDARLAEDMFPLRRQIQTMCDNAKLCAARLTGKEAPTHEDGEQSLAELKARIAEVVAFVGDLTEADFAGADTRELTLAFVGGKKATGQDYLVEFAVPNFYFHAATAYDILRANGVELGKQIYIGSIKLY